MRYGITTSQTNLTPNRSFKCSLVEQQNLWYLLVASLTRHKRHKGLGFFLMTLDQPGVEIRPIQQLTGTSEFNEVFFDEAVCDAADIVGAPGDGWSSGPFLRLIDFGQKATGFGPLGSVGRALSGVPRRS